MHPLDILAKAKTDQDLKALPPARTKERRKSIPAVTPPRRLRQTTLSFGGAAAAGRTAAKGRLRQGRIEEFVGTPKKRRKQEEGEGKAERTRRGTAGSAEKRRSGLFTGGRRQRRLVSDDEEEEEGLGSALVGYEKDRLPEKTGNYSDRGEEAGSTESEDEVVLASPAARRRRPRVIEDDDEEEEAALPPPHRDTDGDEDEDDDDDDDDIPVSSARRRRSSTVKKAASSPARSRVITLDSSSDEPPHPPSSITRRRLRQKPPADSDDDDLTITQPAQNHDDDELDADDLDIAAQTPRTQTRTRYADGKKLTPYQLKLRALQAKRQRATASRGSSVDDASDTAQPRQKALYDTDPEHSAASSAEDELDTPMPDIDSEAELDAWELFHKPGSPSADSWIVDDTQDEPLGAPDDDSDAAAIPLQFTNISHMSHKESFRVYCSFLTLHILLPDLFAAPDEIVGLARRRVEMMLQGYAGSVLTSSVWTPRILRALRERPVLVEEACEVHEGCDACRRDRSSTHRIRLGGPRYDVETLRPVEEDGEEDEDEEEEEEEEEEGDARWFYLGSSCWRRAKLLHAFTHWRWSLREMILGVLEGRGVVDADGRVVAPEGRVPSEGRAKKRKRKRADQEAQRESDEKREKWARGVMEELREEMDALYGDLKGALESARRDMEGQRAGRW